MAHGIDQEIIRVSCNGVDMKQIIPVILCGGSGTRLWPRSRATMPKPFLPLVGDSTLFEATLARCMKDGQFGPPVVVTGTGHLDHVEAQMPGRDHATVIVEPSARNTAAAIALAALQLPPDTIMLVCPSDHHIADQAAFQNAAATAAGLAAEGWLVAFGIDPHAPETGFGYIKQGEALERGGWKIDRFVEKPDLARARAFLAEGGFYWNGGIFCFQAGRFLEELETHRPAIAAAAQAAVAEGRRDGRRFHPHDERFAEIESESVDYAVMEHTARAAMVPVRMGWSDIGNWQALHEARAKDEHGNTARVPHPDRHEIVDSRNVLIESDGPRVSVIGLDNVIVVVDGDEVLVCSAEGAQKVGKLKGALNQ